MHTHLEKQASGKKKQTVQGLKQESQGIARKPVSLELSSLRGERKKGVREVAKGQFKWTGQWLSRPGLSPRVHAFHLCSLHPASRETEWGTDQ